MFPISFFDSFVVSGIVLGFLPVFLRPPGLPSSPCPPGYFVRSVPSQFRCGLPRAVFASLHVMRRSCKVLAFPIAFIAVTPSPTSKCTSHFPLVKLTEPLSDPPTAILILPPFSLASTSRRPFRGLPATGYDMFRPVNGLFDLGFPPPSLARARGRNPNRNYRFVASNLFISPQAEA